jgi:hypothetical protein
VVRRVASGFDTSTPRDEASSFLNPNTSSTLPFAPEAAVGSTININPLIEIYISSASGTSAASAPVQCVCLEVNDTLLEPRKKEIYHSTLRSSSVSYFERTTAERELLVQDTTPAHSDSLGISYTAYCLYIAYVLPCTITSPQYLLVTSEESALRTDLVVRV